MEKIIVKIDWCDKNYGAVIDEHINGVVCVTDRDLHALEKEIKESLRFHVEGCIKDGDKLPGWLIKGDYDLVCEYSASALLRKAQEYTTLTAISRVTGIKHAQLSHYANAISTPKPAQCDRIKKGISEIGKEITALV